MSMEPNNLTKPQLEQAFRLQQAINQALFKALAVGVCVLDDQGYVVSLNHAGARMLGWSESFLRGKSGHDFFECVVQESEHEEGRCPIAKCLETHSMVWTPRTQLRTRQGDWLCVELSSTVLDDVGVSGVMMTFRDLSTELQLREDSRRLASIPEESPFPIIEVDRSGNLLYANEAMTRLMQQTGIRTQGFSAVFPKQFLNLIRECFEENIIKRDIEVDVGQHRYAWLFSPHPETGLVRGFGMDVSERKLAADELAAFADALESKNRELDHALIKAEAATKAKATFLATMSHEIRTPLNGVIGMTEMLMDTPLTTEQVECASLVRSSAEGLLTILNDILDFSKIEAGKLNLEIIAFDVRGLLEEVLDVFAERAHKKGLDLAGLVQSGVPGGLKGDPNRLRQILTNFIGNAIKFTDQGEVLVKVEAVKNEKSKISRDALSGQISGSPPSVDTVPSPSQVFIRFSVQDTGIGIPADVQSRLFQAFSQADVSTTRKYGGTGLGLAISRQLVQLMGGVIGVTTTEGGGATFWCEIPMECYEGSTQSVMVDYSMFNHQRVLGVGCPSATSQMVDELFQDYQVHWTITANCQEALARVQKASNEDHPYTIIMIDSLVPERHQQQFIQKIKANPLLRNIKIIQLVPFGPGVNDPKWQQGGADEVLSKPVHRAQLLRCLETNAHKSSEPPFATKQPDSISEATSLNSSEVSRDKKLSRQGPRVLVAEDNLVNQKVVSWALEKLGCQVALVGTGLEAVKASAGGSYDVILMDWQMPEMDGLEATRTIRAREALDAEREMENERRDTNDEIRGTRDRVPIIGMTANAMKGDREECLEAGMDDYMAKPIRAHQLAEILKKWVPILFNSPTHQSEVLEGSLGQNTSMVEKDDFSSVENVHPSSRSQNLTAGYDVNAALQGVEGDWELLRTLINIFLDSGPKLMVQIREAFQAGELDALRKHTHQLKGAFGTLQALAAADASARVEKASCSENGETLQEAFENLEHQYEELVPLLQGITQGAVSSGKGASSSFPS